MCCLHAFFEKKIKKETDPALLISGSDFLPSSLFFRMKARFVSCPLLPRQRLNADRKQ